MRIGGLSCWDVGMFVFRGYVAINANAFWCFQFFQKTNKKKLNFQVRFLEELKTPNVLSKSRSLEEKKSYLILTHQLTYSNQSLIDSLHN